MKKTKRQTKKSKSSQFQKIIMYSIPLDLSVSELKKFSKLGLKWIKNDTAALAEYAIVKLLTDYVMSESKNKRIK